MSDTSETPAPAPDRPPVAARAGRPPRNFRTDNLTRALRLVAVGIVAATVLTVIVIYPNLPDEIPTHFGPTGEADGWGPKSSLFLLVGIGAAVVCGIAWLSRHPEWLNYLGVVTELNAQDHYRNGEQMTVWMAVCMAVLFAGIPLSAVAQGSMGWPILVAGAGVIVSLVVGVTRMIRIR